MLHEYNLIYTLITQLLCPRLFFMSLFKKTGAQPVATLHTTLSAKAYGMVRGVTVRQFGSKTMLHLHPPGESAICTMVLCHRNETMLSELKVR